MSMSEWTGLAERLRLVDPTAFEELLVELRALVESWKLGEVAARRGLRPGLDLR